MMTAKIETSDLSETNNTKNVVTPSPRKTHSPEFIYEHDDDADTLSSQISTALTTDSSPINAEFEALYEQEDDKEEGQEIDASDTMTKNKQPLDEPPIKTKPKNKKKRIRTNKQLGSIPISKSASTSSKNDKAHCEYFNEESNLDDGELPSLKVPVKTSLDGRSRRINGFDDEVTDDESCSTSDSYSDGGGSVRLGDVTSVRELSPRSRLRHRAFWNQFDNPDDDEDDDGPDDEVAFRRTLSSASRNRTLKQTPLSNNAATGKEETKKIPLKKGEVVEEEEEDQNGIMAMVVDICSDCGWEKDKKEDEKGYSARITDVRRTSSRSNSRSRENGKGGYRSMGSMVYEDDTTDGGSTVGGDDASTLGEYSARDMQKYHSSKYRYGEFENTAIEVEYVEPDSDDDVTTATDADAESDFDGKVTHSKSMQSLEPTRSATPPVNNTTIANGATPVIKNESQNDKKGITKEGFLQIGEEGKVAVFINPKKLSKPVPSRSTQNVQKSASEADADDSDTRSISSHDKGGSMLAQSKSWSAPEKNAYLRSMAKKAKADYKRRKGIEDEALEDAVAKGAALAQRHGNDQSDDREKDDDETVESIDSVDKILGERPLVRSRSLGPSSSGSVVSSYSVKSGTASRSASYDINWSKPQYEDWTPAEKRRCVQLMHSETCLSLEDATNRILEARKDFSLTNTNMLTSQQHLGRSLDNHPSASSVRNSNMMETRKRETDNSLFVASDKWPRASSAPPSRPTHLKEEEENSMVPVSVTTSYDASGTPKLSSAKVTNSSQQGPSPTGVDHFPPFSKGTETKRSAPPSIAAIEKESRSNRSMTSVKVPKPKKSLYAPMSHSGEENAPSGIVLDQGEDVDKPRETKSDFSSSSVGSKLATSILANLKKKPAFNKMMTNSRSFGSEDPSERNAQQEMLVDQANKSDAGVDNVRKEHLQSKINVNKKKDKKANGEWQPLDDSYESENEDKPLNFGNLETLEKHEDTNKKSNQGTNDDDNNSLFDFDEDTTVQGGNKDEDSPNKVKKTLSRNKPEGINPVVPVVTLDPYHDSSDVSVITGMTGATDGISVGSRSIYTSMTSTTSASSWSTSTRKRHRGAAKKRIKNLETNRKQELQKPNGWLESIHKAAAANNREWDAKVGWVGYVEPDKPEIENDFQRIGSLKKLNNSILPKSRSKKRLDVSKEDENSDGMRNHVPFPSSWEKERQEMVGSYDEEDGTGSEITEVVGNGNQRKRHEEVPYLCDVPEEENSGQELYNAGASDVTEVHGNLKKNLDAELDKIQELVPPLDKVGEEEETTTIESVDKDLLGEVNTANDDSGIDGNKQCVISESVEEDDDQSYETAQTAERRSSEEQNRGMFHNDTDQISESDDQESPRDDGVFSLKKESEDVGGIGKERDETVERKSLYNWIDKNEESPLSIADDISSINDAPLERITPIRPSQLDFENSDGKTLEVTVPELELKEELSHVKASKLQLAEVDENVHSEGKPAGKPPLASNRSALTVPEVRMLESTKSLDTNGKGSHREKAFSSPINIEAGTSADDDEDDFFPEDFSNNFGESFDSSTDNVSSRDNPNSSLELDGFKVISKSDGRATLLNEDNASESTPADFVDNPPLSTTQDTADKDGTKYNGEGNLNSAGVPPPPPPPPKSDLQTDTISRQRSRNDASTSTSLNSVSTKAKEWIELIELRKNQAPAKDWSHSSAKEVSDKILVTEGPTAPPPSIYVNSSTSHPRAVQTTVFVSAADDNSAFQYSDGLKDDDDDTLFEFDDRKESLDVTLASDDDKGSIRKNKSTEPRTYTRRGDAFERSAPPLEMDATDLISLNSKSVKIPDDLTQEENIRPRSEAGSVNRSEVSLHDQRNDSFFSRLQSCAAPVMDRFSSSHTASNQEVGGEVPLAHLAFLRKTQEASPTSFSKNSKRKESVLQMLTPTLCGRPSTIHEEEDGTQRRSAPSRKENIALIGEERVDGAAAVTSNEIPMHSQDKFSKDLNRQSNKRDSYPEHILRKNIDQVHEGPPSVISSTSSLKSGHSEAWKRFLEKRASSGITASRKSNNSDVSTAAEKYAAAKVDQIMKEITKSSGGPDWPKDDVENDKRQQINGVNEAMSDCGSSYSKSSGSMRKKFGKTFQPIKIKSESAKAAERLAAARVEAMMAAMSSSNLDEGEI